MRYFEDPERLGLVYAFAEGDEVPIGLSEIDWETARAVATAQPVSLEQAQAQQRAALAAWCRDAITAGVVCDALGTPHTYPTAPTDQQNLTGLVVESLLPGQSGPFLFWCADEVGVWARREHSAAQIWAVGLAVAAQVKDCQTVYEGLLLEVDAAATVAEVRAVVWPED